MNQRITQWAAAGIAGLGMVVLTGCAQPPTEQLEAAQKAVEAARTAGAPDYAKEDFAKLQQELALAKDELAKQEKALSIFHSYTDADKMLTRVAEMGKEVEAKVVSSKEAAKTAALTREKEAQTVVASAKELLVKAPTGKDRAAVESIKQDLTGLEGNLRGIHQMIEQGDYLGAETQARALKDKGAAVSEEIQKAIEKAKGKRTKAHA